MLCFHLDYILNTTGATKDISLVIGINDNRNVKFVSVMKTYRL